MGILHLGDTSIIIRNLPWVYAFGSLTWVCLEFTRLLFHICWWLQILIYVVLWIILLRSLQISGGMRCSRLKCYNCFKKEVLEKASLLSVLAYLVSFCHCFQESHGECLESSAPVGVGLFVGLYANCVYLPTSLSFWVGCFNMVSMFKYFPCTLYLYIANCK